MLAASDAAQGIQRLKNIRAPMATSVTAKMRRSHKLGNMLSAYRAEITAYQKAGGQQQADWQKIGVAIAVVLQESEDADRRQQCRQTGALCPVLIHAQQPDQCGRRKSTPPPMPTMPDTTPIRSPIRRIAES